MKEFKNKKILLTGGAQGIGLAMVKKFEKIFSEVIFIDKEKNKGKNLQKYFQKKGSNVYFYHCDLNNFKKSIKLFRKILKKHKNINYLINNAKAGTRNKILDESEKNWNTSINVILKNSFFFSQEFINHNKSKNISKSILNISSIVTSIISKESPSYHAAKSGLEGITKYLASHAGKYGVRINSVSPGFIVQQRYLKKFFSKKNNKYRKSILDFHPMKNFGTEDDIVNSVLFLLSDSSKFINGSNISIDGALSKNSYLQLQNKIK
tara:strand:- start:907 stop:1701 length:795 start_codon:yes stop_codon:yes gene_type:complete